MKAWVAERLGKPTEVLKIHEKPIPEPGPNELLVKLETTTLNFNDIDAIYGRYTSLQLEAPFVPGYEGLGRVVKAGAGAEDWVGKRVVGWPNPLNYTGSYTEYMTMPPIYTFEVPDDMPTTCASGILLPFHVAWLSIFTRGKLQKGETILIHAAAGGVGSSALQLAVDAGARVIATAGSDEKVKTCLELGADVAINYNKDNFVEHVMDATQGRGVDVALDSIGGDITEQTWKCLNFGARHLIIGFASGIEQEDERPITLRETIFGNFSLVGCNINYVEDSRSQESWASVPVNFNSITRAQGVEMHNKIIELIQSKAVTPLIGLETSFDKLPSAIEALENREIVGRAVIHMD